MITCPTTYATYKDLSTQQKTSLIVLNLVKSCAIKRVRVFPFLASRTRSCHKALNKLCYAKISKFSLVNLAKRENEAWSSEKKRKKRVKRKKKYGEKKKTEKLHVSSHNKKELLIEAHLPSSFPSHLHIAGNLFWLILFLDTRFDLVI